jgi:NAD(P)-dependent dehydrogenase (short-subunit alcohol dehydrogenase family)
VTGRVEGKVAIVTGAGSSADVEGVGIGQAIATVLVREGATVLLVDKDPARAQNTIDSYGDLPGKGVVFEADVTNKADCEAMVAAAVEQFGGLDILVNNAAISRHYPITATPDEEYDAILIERGGGSIIMIGSVAGVRDSGVTHPAYCASKAGQLGLMLDLAGEYGRQNVRVNAVLPGMVRSPMQASVSGGGLTEDHARRLNMLGRMGDAWDVAHGVLYLCTDEASYVTAHVLPTDGGATQSMPGSAGRADRMPV